MAPSPLQNDFTHYLNKSDINEKRSWETDLKKKKKQEEERKKDEFLKSVDKVSGRVLCEK